MINIKSIFSEPTLYRSIWLRSAISSLFSIITAWIFFRKFRGGDVAVLMSYAMICALAGVFWVTGVLSVLSFSINFRKIVSSTDLRNEGIYLLNANSKNPFYVMTNDFLNEKGRKVRSRLIIHLIFFIISFIVGVFLVLAESYLFGQTGIYPMVGR